MPPLRCRWLADGVLVAEQTHLVDGFCIRHRFNPVHPHEVFRLFGIIGILFVALTKLEHVQHRFFAIRRLHGKFLAGAHRFGHAAHADIADAGDFHPHSVAGRQHPQGLTVPAPAARADEAILARILPAPRIHIAERNVILPVPRLFLAFAFRCHRHVGLRLAGVDQPCAAQQLLVAVLKHLEEHRIDRDVARVQVADDALGGRIQFCRDDDDLVRLVERILIEHRAKMLPERLVQLAAAGKTLVNLRDLFRSQLLHPRGIVQCLRDDLARRAVALEFDQHQRTIGRNCQQVDASAVAGDLLPPDQHPLAGEDARVAHDHLFQFLLAGELACG